MARFRAAAAARTAAASAIAAQTVRRERAPASLVRCMLCSPSRAGGHRAQTSRVSTAERLASRITQRCLSAERSQIRRVRLPRRSPASRCRRRPLGPRSLVVEGGSDRLGETPKPPRLHPLWIRDEERPVLLCDVRERGSNGRSASFVTPVDQIARDFLTAGKTSTSPRQWGQVSAPMFSIPPNTRTSYSRNLEITFLASRCASS